MWGLENHWKSSEIFINPYTVNALEISPPYWLIISIFQGGEARKFYEFIYKFYIFVFKGVMLIPVFLQFLMGDDRDISKAFTVIFRKSL